MGIFAQPPVVMVLAAPNERIDDFFQNLPYRVIVQHSPAILKSDLVDPVDIIFITASVLINCQETLPELIFHRTYSSRGEPLKIGLCNKDTISTLLPRLGKDLDDCLVLPEHPELIKSHVANWIEIGKLRTLKKRYKGYISIFMHDMKNRLNSIVGHSQLLQRKLETYTPEKTSKLLSQISAESKQVYAWTSDLSELSHLEELPYNYFMGSGSSTLQVKHIVDTVLSEIYPIRQRFEALNKQLVVRVPLLDPIKGYEWELVKALYCLLNNLCDITVLGGVATIEAEQTVNQWNAFSAEAIHVTITDFIKDVPQNRPLPFGYKYDDQIVVMGMDRQLAKAILEAHGGQVWTDSVEGEELSFHFILPVTA